MNQKDIVKRVLDAKVIDFKALGAFVSESGAALAVADEPGDTICGIGPRMIRFIRLSGPGGMTVNPVELSGAGEELNG